ncbi:MAG TPA: AmmeMemoRadiSam system protein A [Myxococcota bacterium]|nr:AmmeMemoRadiSam system protein A [Myxococcota bacterium]HRY92127.1 AmmeMemoRadiSam system protein A [Myxococcota bacterium]HSA21732.1 AmmeMemoRadiSam system protein A [Myxococcota bacterium]
MTGTPREDELTPEERALLLRTARQAISDQLQGCRVTPAEPTGARLAALAGAFVSLHAAGDLRGCIGTFVGRRPLVQTVQEMAVSAAFRDPRFPPLAADELAGLELEISVLSPLRQISDVSEIEVGRHGLYITRGLRAGVLLPQVATEFGWDREEFLAHTCMKAGLPPEAWREGGTRIELFEAQVFGERQEQE